MALADDPVLFAAVLIVAAFGPPLAYLVWARQQERYAPEPWRSLAKAFGWGAIGGTGLALVLEMILGVPPHALQQLGLTGIFFTAVIVAPPVEEFTKAVGLRLIDDAHLEPEDGLVYGAAIGLGFAATENLVYEVAAYLEGGTTSLIQTAVLRSLSSAFLHGAATALVGYAVWRRRAGQASSGDVLGAYLGAVLLHAAYNFGASIALAVAFLVSMVLAVGGFWWVRKRIRELDARGRPRAQRPG